MLRHGFWPAVGLLAGGASHGVEVAVIAGNEAKFARW